MRAIFDLHPPSGGDIASFPEAFPFSVLGGAGKRRVVFGQGPGLAAGFRFLG
jgi:hypothetical protein